MKIFSDITIWTVVSAIAFGACVTPAFAHNGQDHGLTVVPPSNPPLDVAGDILTNIVGSESTQGKYSILDILVQPQSGPPLHIHNEEDELFYILEGEVSLQLNDQAFTATPGTFAYLPKGQPHAFRNLGTDPARMLAFGTPPGFEHIARSVGIPVTGTPQPPPTDFSFIDDFLDIAAQYEVTFPDTLILPTAATRIDDSGVTSAFVPVLRPGIDDGPASGYLTVSDGTDLYANVKIPVNFADKERFQLVQIPLYDSTLNGQPQTLKVTLTDTREDAFKSKLQNQALIQVGGTGDPLNDVLDLYNLPSLVPVIHPSVQFGGETINFLATSELTDGNFSLFEVKLDPLSTSEYGVHGSEDEGFLVVEGEISFGDDLIATPGTFVYAPKGNTYKLTNNGSSPARAFLMNVPSGLEDHFEQIQAQSVPENTSLLPLFALGLSAIGLGGLKKFKS